MYTRTVMLRATSSRTGLLARHHAARLGRRVTAPHVSLLHSSAAVRDDHRFGKPYGALPEFVDDWSVRRFYIVGTAGTAGAAVTLAAFPITVTTCVPAAVVALYWAIGIRDINQSAHAILRNFPVLGHVRFFLESIRPNIRQSFIESDTEKSGVPFDRAHRALAYQRAKAMTDTVPLGTKRDVYEDGYSYAMHSMFPKHVNVEDARITVGNYQCSQPYSASVLNISAMSYGALSENAILALNLGAKLGNFYHNTGEGGLSSFHLRHGGDIVWNIGTGYFACRNPDGTFNADKFVQNASQPSVKMIEIKLSQGAKPSHGGVLPKEKITKEIAFARGLEFPALSDCLSPPSHSEFSNAEGLIDFVARLRQLSGGKPVGFKLCIGRPDEFMAIVHAMKLRDVYPDFITVDGGEGGTGAAPPEFSNSIGTPLVEGLTFVNNALRGAGVREHIKLICAGKVLTGFSIVDRLALGADICNSARAMMYALGCIQALKCNTNKCPTGVATSDKVLMRGLVVEDKCNRVANFHERTVKSACEIMGAIGCAHPADVRPTHIMKRIDESTVASVAELYPLVEYGAFEKGTGPPALQAMWDRTRDRTSLSSAYIATRQEIIDRRNSVGLGTYL
eukprot:m.96822 g.96822  ORF g.96822 m.96822 type:complete len:621 (+) comp10184_c2_seq1:140-2002(+)